MKTGTFVISLDFELFWGMHDVATVATYGEHVRGEREAVPGMLALFERYGIRATWATVGMLAHRTRDELLHALPPVRPVYRTERFSTYSHLEAGAVGRDEGEDPYHFGASLLAKVRATPGQEVACHTFSHYYCLEVGADLESFRADLVAWRAAVDPEGRAVSIVFPRNQVSREHLTVCRELGFLAYRGTQEHPIYAPATTGGQYRLTHRALRLLDTYLPLTGSHTTVPMRQEGLVNIPASAFLRSYQPCAPLEWLKLRRVARGMEQAAARGEVYHLWWHPHNFGVHTRENLRLLERILAHFDALRRRGTLVSKSMGDVAREVSA